MVKRLTQAARRRLDMLAMSFGQGYLGALGAAAMWLTGWLAHWIWVHL